MPYIQQECEDIPTGAIGIGRRAISARSHEPHACDYCCTSDLCNSNCAGNSTITPGLRTMYKY